MPEHFYSVFHKQESQEAKALRPGAEAPVLLTSFGTTSSRALIREPFMKHAPGTCGCRITLGCLDGFGFSCASHSPDR
jgi:hypothetical protein